MSHTPGPWRILRGNETGRPMCVCPVLRWGGLAKPADPATEANAHLIAAAPELLAAARSVVAKWNETLADYPGAEPILGWPAEIDKLRAAIAKAKGKA